MAEISYEKLALDWQPGGRKESKFNRLVLVVLTVMLSIGVIMSLLEVPEKERRERSEIPDRVARFIAQQERPRVEPPPPPPPLPKPEPLPPPVIEEVPRVERERPSTPREPLTEADQQAREVAERSGLLALRQEMSGLFDSAAEVRGSLAGNLPGDTGSGGQVAAGHDASVITSGSPRTSGGVDASLYAAGRAVAQLSDRELAQVDDSLLADTEPTRRDSAGRESRRPGDGRLQEDVTVVFDQHKGSLYSLYERERRRTPGLQGVVVVELSIASNGEVTDVRIISSELNNPSLEERLIARIRTFVFGDKDVPPVTVTFPIEFLPS